ncbi:MAG: hypothetical protein JNL57_04115 [Bacteroidetes bacterium]|nr:hypothetical protein [Bacteroidota bacterium]
MKKIYFFAAILAMTMAACNSNQGAYTEDEKKVQDSADSEKHEDKFEAMQKEIDKQEDSAKKADHAPAEGTEKK